MVRNRSWPAVSYTPIANGQKKNTGRTSARQGRVRTHMLSFTFLPFTSILCTYETARNLQHLISISTIKNQKQKERNHHLTRKSTPMVALVSSSGSHCSSENLRSKLLFPTDELPIRRSLQLMGGAACWFSMGAIGGVR